MFLYKVYEPAPVLKPFVANYSIVENTAPLMHHILLKAALVLSIQYSGSMKLAGEEAQVFDRYTSGLAGVQSSYRIIEKEHNTGVLFINFTEAGAGAFFKLAMHELNDAGVTLDLMLPASTVARLEEEVVLADTADERVARAEAMLLTLLREQQQDLLILSAIQEIRMAGGNIRIEDLARTLCISAGRLEKRFRHAVGVSPKKFASMERIAWLIKNYQKEQSLTRLAYHAGYYDQAHSIRDLRQYTGLAPKQLFGSLAVVSGNVEQPCGIIYGSNLPPEVSTDL